MTTVRSLGGTTAELKETLIFLEKVANHHLDARLHALLHKDGGLVLELHKRVSVQLSDDNDSVHDALSGMLTSSTVSRVASILHSTVNNVLHTAVVGTVEKTHYVTLWENNVLMCVQFYLWRYRFSSGAILGGINSVYAYAVVKRARKWNSIKLWKAKEAIGREDTNPTQVALIMKTMHVRQPDWLVKWLAPKPRRPHKKTKKKKRRRKRKGARRN